jgi:Patatin-like phospholipase
MEAEPAHQVDLTANVTPGSESNPVQKPGVGEAPTAGRTTLVNRAEITHQPRIVSLDGGGVRGISALVILEEIMKEVRRRENLKDVPLPCDYFDLIGGTSTGGLIAIMLGRLRMVLTVLRTI